MLELFARPYLELTHKFGLLLAGGKPVDPDIVRDVWSDLLKDTKRLNLPVTHELVVDLFEEFVKANPTSFKQTPDGFRVVGAQLPYGRMAHHCEAIYKTLLAELSSLQLRVIPREKAKYCDPKWLTDTAMFRNFPESTDEFQKAGRCFSYGENTACVFHLMRITDFYLRKVAESIGATYDARNWQGIGSQIAKQMEQKYNLKSDDWKNSEPFYAEVLTDIQAIGRGHRNPVLHELEKKYDEREAGYLLTVIEAFAKHVSVNIVAPTYGV